MATYKFTLVSPGFATIQKDNGRTTPFSGSFESTGLADDDGAFFILTVISHSYQGNFKMANNSFLINGLAPTGNTADAILNQICKEVFPKATTTGGGGGSEIESLDDVPDSATRLAFSPTERTKLNGVADNATANVGDVTLNGAQTLTNKILTAPVINNPTGITKSDVGLGNVPNLSFSGSNTGDESQSSIISKIGYTPVNPSSIVAATATEISNSTQINFVGDSFIDLSSNWTSPVLQFKTLTGLKGNNLGVTGTTTTQIKAKFDAQVAANPALLNQSWVFEGGRNDITQNGAVTGTATTIKANIAAMVASLATVSNTRYLIMGVVPANTETAVSSAGIFVAQLNADLSALYGSHFVPMAAAIQAGGNGGTNDNADIAAGIMPRSLMYDAIHPNTAGFAIEAQQLINNIATLVPNQGKYLTIASVGGLLQQGQLTFNLGTGGALNIGDYQAIKVPNQNTTSLANTLIVGSGGNNLSHTTGSEGQTTTLVGMQAGSKLTTGYGNTAVGYAALFNNLVGRDNVAIGESAGLNNTANANTFIGKDAGRNNTSGLSNAFLTASAGLGTSTANGSIYAGFNSGFANNGGANTAIGVSALQNNSGASANNVAIGSEALKGATGVAGQNIGIGRQTGMVNTGSNNVFIGDLAGDNNSSGSKNLVVSHQGDVQSATASNQVNIGNVIWATGASGTGTTPAGSVGIGTISPSASAILDLTSTTQGLLLPRMTKTQRDAITKVAGLAIFQTDNTPGLRVCDGTNWIKYTETID